MSDQNIKESKRIILLEDEVHLGRFYEKHLIKKGFEVLWFQNSEDLMREHDKHTIHAALIDQSLESEGKTGIEIIPILKMAHPKTKIIMLSNYSQFEMEEMAKKAGADSYLLKIDNPPASVALYLEKLLG